MKSKRSLEKPFLFLLVLVFSTSCVSQPLSPTQFESVKPSAITSTLAENTKSASSTASPSSTPQPTEIASFTPSPPTVMPTPIPTISDQDRGKAIEELIRTNNNCKLPCFWGVTPGKSTWADATRFFERMNARFSSDSKAVISYTLSFDASAKGASTEHVYNTFTFSTQNQADVDSIEVEGNGAEIPMEFPRLWESYSPEKVISVYGKPSRVFLSSEPDYFGDTGKVGYFLWVFYDERGFMIRYNGHLKFSPKYRFCPTIHDEGEIDGIHLVSINLNNNIPLEKQDEIFESGYHKIISFEEATGQPNEEFTHLFLQNEKPACFDVSREVWK